jgi:hypothetical protein
MPLPALDAVPPPRAYALSEPFLADSAHTHSEKSSDESNIYDLIRPISNAGVSSVPALGGFDRTVTPSMFLSRTFSLSEPANCPYKL